MSASNEGTVKAINFHLGKCIAYCYQRMPNKSKRSSTLIRRGALLLRLFRDVSNGIIFIYDIHDPIAGSVGLSLLKLKWAKFLNLYGHLRLRVNESDRFENSMLVLYFVVFESVSSSI